MAVAVPQAYPNLVGGRLAPAADGATFVRANPAQLDDAVSRFPQATAADLEAAVANEPTTGIEYQVPSGGLGDSGFGDPELGPSALEFFSALKAVYWSHGV